MPIGEVNLRLPYSRQKHYQLSYAAPSLSYAAPSLSYVAPLLTYAAPWLSYAALHYITYLCSYNSLDLPNHKVHIYLEYQSVCPLVRIGTLHPPLPPASESLPPEPKEGEHTRLRVRRWGGPNSDDWRKSLALCLLCVPNCIPHLKEMSNHLKCVTRLIRFAVKKWRSGNFFKSFLMTQSHERSITPFTAAWGFLRWLCPTKVTFRDFLCLRKVIF